jgi:hypothetical protein
MCFMVFLSLFLSFQEVPLEVNEKKAAQVLMELKTLHSSSSPHIISFYGAFYLERAVHLLLESVICFPLSFHILVVLGCLRSVSVQVHGSGFAG